MGRNVAHDSRARLYWVRRVQKLHPGRSEPRQSVLYPINPVNARIYPWPSSRLRGRGTRYRLEINSTVNPTSGGYVAVRNLLRPCLSPGSTRPPFSPVSLLFLCFAPAFLTVRDWRIFRFLPGFIRHWIWKHRVVREAWRNWKWKITLFRKRSSSFCIILYEEFARIWFVQDSKWVKFETEKRIYLYILFFNLDFLELIIAELNFLLERLFYSFFLS